jgi:hypothetical protein
VEGGGEEAAAEEGHAAAGFEEGDLGEEADFVFDAEAAIEIEEVDAAAEKDVLAVVDNFGVREGVGSGASAQEGFGFEYLYGSPCAS